MDNFREDPNEFISRQGSHLSLSVRTADEVLGP
jgi:hypothetical protein